MIDLYELPLDEMLVLALEDMRADSGNHEPLDKFLRDTFTDKELAAIGLLCVRILDRCVTIRLGE